MQSSAFAGSSDRNIRRKLGRRIWVFSGFFGHGSAVARNRRFVRGRFAFGQMLEAGSALTASDDIWSSVHLNMPHWDRTIHPLASNEISGQDQSHARFSRRRRTRLMCPILRAGELYLRRFAVPNSPSLAPAYRPAGFRPIWSSTMRRIREHRRIEIAPSCFLRSFPRPLLPFTKSCTVGTRAGACSTRWQPKMAAKIGG